MIYEIKNKIYLHLPNEKKLRLIGTLDNNVLYVYRDVNKHLHRNTNSLGFNSKVLEQYDIKFLFVTLNNKEKFNIPIEEVHKNGFYMHYLKQGFEKQIFIPFDQIKKFNINGTS